MYLLKNNNVLYHHSLFQIPKDFAFSLYDLDWTQFPHLSNAVKLVPEFETVGIKSTICGPESFTPDHKPLLGKLLLIQRTLTLQLRSIGARSPFRVVIKALAQDGSPGFKQNFLLEHG